MATGKERRVKQPLELAARALCRLDGYAENATMEGKELWRDYLREARTVLAAIREPTDEIVDAGYASAMPGETGKRELFPRSVWEAMIDEALAQEP